MSEEKKHLPPLKEYMDLLYRQKLKEPDLSPEHLAKTRERMERYAREKEEQLRGRKGT